MEKAEDACLTEASPVAYIAELPNSGIDIASIYQNSSWKSQFYIEEFSL